MPINFNKITPFNAWFLGFLYAEATLGIQENKRFIKIYNKDRDFVLSIKNLYGIPYKVTTQANKNNTVYFIRIGDQLFIDSIEKIGFKKNKDLMHFPVLNKLSTIQFMKGFIKGKGSFFQEKKRNNYGFKIIYRSKLFMDQMAIKIAEFTRAKHAKTYLREIKNVVSCELKYNTIDCDLIKEFIEENQQFHTTNPT